MNPLAAPAVNWPDPAYQADVAALTWRTTREARLLRSLRNLLCKIERERVEIAKEANDIRSAWLGQPNAPADRREPSPS